MLAMAYFGLLSAPAPPPIERTVTQIALFLVAVIGIAGFGHLFTDMFDVDEDRQRRQSNTWGDAGTARRTLLLAGVLLASSLPWAWIPIGRLGALLLAAEFMMFALYAVPPIRLKSRGLPGIVADGMYAHALPALWSWLPFAHLSGAETLLWIGVVIGIWGLSVGVRELMHHQAIDAEPDRAAGAMTYGARRGRQHLMRVLQRFVLPIELASLILLLGAIGTKTLLPAAGFALYFGWSIIKVRATWLERIALFPVARNEDGVTILARGILSPFYYGWLPLLLAAALALRDNTYLILLGLHFVLFRAMITRLVEREAYSTAIAVRALLRNRVRSPSIRRS